MHHPGDVTALLLGADERVGSIDDLAFYNQPFAAATTWSAGPPQMVQVRLGELDPAVRTVRILLSVDPGTEALGKRPAPRAELTGESTVSATFIPEGLPTERALIVCEIYRRGPEWVRAVGQGYDGGLSQALTAHGVDVEESQSAAARAASSQTASAASASARRPARRRWKGRPQGRRSWRTRPNRPRPCNRPWRTRTTDSPAPSNSWSPTRPPGSVRMRTPPGPPHTATTTRWSPRPAPTTRATWPSCAQNSLDGRARCRRRWHSGHRRPGGNGQPAIPGHPDRHIAGR